MQDTQYGLPVVWFLRGIAATSFSDVQMQVKLEGSSGWMTRCDSGIVVSADSITVLEPEEAKDGA